ncbi:protein TEX261 [Bacillus rossius redtenbacheri]|uniref:protein TEX261 n=1 Tax=Bacillus rossius redtenbacheri TaxID=93214 RepID=UPI002FDD4369
MWFFYLMSWIALIVQICFITISVAAGLYYVAELVEEYTVATKKVIWWMIMVTLLVYAGLVLFEDFPAWMLACGVLGQAAHLLILNTFPYFKLSSPAFALSVLLLLLNHYLAFQFFSSVLYSFSEVLAYFTLCLWLVPFALFVSLSANENILPTVAERRHLLDDNDVVTNYFSQKGKKYGLLTFFNYAKDSILPQRNKKVF